MTTARRPFEFLRFLAVGGFAAAVNFGSRILYNLWTGYSVAILLAYLTGMVTAFLLNRTYVFPQGSNSTARSALLFTAINVLAALQTWGVSILLARYLLPSMGVRKFMPEIAHAVGVAVPVVTSYLGHRRWTYR
jgi:putative flippase GtrA